MSVEEIRTLLNLPDPDKKAGEEPAAPAETPAEVPAETGSANE